jgi:ribonucleotide monophosphatase NagD (HAD superfamily)
MKMGFDHGLTTILVLSGETTQADVETATQKPDYVFSGLDELVKNMLV